MHILLGFLIAAVLIYFWARGSIIVAIMATLGCLCIGAVGAGGWAIMLLVASWAPIGVRRYLLEPKFAEPLRLDVRR